jgi:hypothetical protein
MDGSILIIFFSDLNSNSVWSLVHYLSPEVLLNEIWTFSFNRTKTLDVSKRIAAEREMNGVYSEIL